ncbi:MAG: metallophosphoesterase family protein [Desulfocapsaceae bacterium]|nr:metallophosphoesterase family protein [Desulfocapsaceae bacterium]
MIRAGILSDTHMSMVNQRFKDDLDQAFNDCEVIFHAGDITSLIVLEVFQSKVLYAVHGNMCDMAVQKQLPDRRVVKIENQVIGICHGTGSRHNIEERMWAIFPEADCIIYGHTHQPVCHRYGDILFVNPGSFHSSGPHGAPPSYAKLTVDGSSCQAELFTLAVDR